MIRRKTAENTNEDRAKHGHAEAHGKQGPFGSPTPASTLSNLQQRVGNRAVQRIIELPPIVITGDPQFYSRALRSNKYYSAHPPLRGWPYDPTLRALWEKRAYDDFADRVREIQQEKLGPETEQADGILGPKTAKLLAQSSEPARLEIVNRDQIPDRILNGLIAYQQPLAASDSAAADPLNTEQQRVFEEARRLASEIDRLKGIHSEQLRHKRESPVLGGIVDFFGGLADIPELNIWDWPTLQLDNILRQLGSSSIEEVRSLLNQVEESVKENKRQLGEYSDDMEAGGDRVVWTLELVKSIGENAAGTIGGSLGGAAGATAGEEIYSAITTVAEGVSESYQGQKVDVLEKGRDWGVDFLLGFLTDKLSSGYLRPFFEKHFGPYLNNFTDSELLEIGLSRDSLVPKGTKRLIDFLTGAGQSAFHDFAKSTIDPILDLLSGEKKDPSEFMDKWISNMMKEGLAEAFIEFLKQLPLKSRN